MVKDQTIHQPRRIRIIVIGAGISGIAFAYKIKALGNVEYQIYEKNEDVGGTWFESRYPGCSCDIPAHSYTYPWVGNPNWSRLWVPIHTFPRSCGVYIDCVVDMPAPRKSGNSTATEPKSTVSIRRQSSTTKSLEQHGTKRVGNGRSRSKI